MYSRTGSRSWRASSGSRSASNSIELFRSANKTVTCLRSPSSTRFEVWIFSTKCPGVYLTGDGNCGAGVVAGCALSGVPHSLQNLARGSASVPQCGQRGLRGAPHSMQNLLPSGVSASQCGQRMRASPAQQCLGPGGAIRDPDAPLPRERSMGVQYPRLSSLSSEKPKTALAADGEGRGETPSRG